MGPPNRGRSREDNGVCPRFLGNGDCPHYSRGRMLADLGTAIVVFIVTNVDDIVLLAVLFGGALAARAVVAGQFIGIAVIIAVSVGAAYAATAVPPHWIDWL